MTVPVHGVPFCNQTRIVKNVTMKEHTNTHYVLEADSKTLDAPYSDTFSCKEAYVFIEDCSKKYEETLFFQRFMKIDFVKYTMFRSKITTQAELGIIDASKIWFNQAYERGFLTGLPAPQEEEKEP